MQRSLKIGAPPRGPNGERLCRWCGVEVTPPRRTFCSGHCVVEWNIRSNPGFARNLVAKRDKGVCARCGLDTREEQFRVYQLSVEERQIFEKREHLSHRSSWWDMDHILPVHQGGGCCGLTNLQTLCWRCHHDKTRENRAGKLES